MRVYIVRWCDHEGNLHERQYGGLTTAKAEARYLDHTYDGVEVVDHSGQCLWPEE